MDGPILDESSRSINNIPAVLGGEFTLFKLGQKGTAHLAAEIYRSNRRRAGLRFGIQCIELGIKE